jgi:serine protease Do
MEFNNNSWESGVKFVEEKRPKRFFRFIGMMLVIVFSASIGGIIGGYYVKKSYIDSQYGQNLVGNTQGNVNNLTSTPETVNIPKNSITKVAELVGPAVVGINNNITTKQGVIPRGSGSGIIFDASGYIVTNNHVVQGATSVTVILPGNKTPLPARIIGVDSKTDLAVIKIEAQNLPVAKFGDSSKVRVGEIAVAIGNPLGQEFAGSVTVGYISAVNRTMKFDNKEFKLIQTDAAINQGNSGGALTNEAGEVIGINTLKSLDAEGMGFAIPINEAKPVIEELLKNGYVARPFLGISYQFIDEESAKAYKTPVGALIQQVISGSGAEGAGIRAQDILVAFDGQELKDEDVLPEIIRKHKIGDVVNAKIWRDGKYIELSVTLKDSSGK